jgi:hypothetical protein
MAVHAGAARRGTSHRSYHDARIWAKQGQKALHQEYQHALSMDHGNANSRG